jgi:hypothetical protein
VTVAGDARRARRILQAIAHARLANQRLAGGGFTRPGDVVRWLGAVQAQDYLGARWALALRMRRGTDAAIERAFAAGAILRTHVMRPTWHFVAPDDIRWMLSLTAPRVRAALGSYDRKLGLDAAVITRSHKAVAAALTGGTHLTRQELKTRLESAGIVTDGVQRLAHLVMHAELSGVICSGPIRGRQFTYALLDERVPETRSLSRDAALAELTRRYFRSHGPAGVQDFVWWSGLTTTDARAGLEMVQRELVEDIVDGKTFWRSADARAAGRPSRTAYLLPPYDEYLIAYRDRSAALDGALWKSVVAGDPFSAAIVLDGRVVGGWTRTMTKGKVAVGLSLPVPLTSADSRLVVDAARRFASFLGLDIAIARK